MIPSLVVNEVRDSLVEYLASTFALADDEVRDALTDFLQDNADGIFRGPYLRVRTPFVSVDNQWMSRPPLDWLPDGFRPYAHQATAFDRLSSRDSDPEPTIVTTGTGSGKTECFLFPILDHCARMTARGQQGIKAIILYPMNALATDQANRIAETIANNPQLAGVSAGLFIGGDGTNSTMSAEHIIDNNDVLRSNPPDILLTNYKMLDFLLLRRTDRDLWAVNQPDTLRYVVLDEFHTYDGAQGTDVAMLLRRLGQTLGMAEQGRPLGAAVPVATSATLASDPGALEELRSFAHKVFGARFDESAVIGETRQHVDEVCSDIDYNLLIPNVDDVLDADDADDVAAAFCAKLDDSGDITVAATIDDELSLGAVLERHPMTRAVLAAVGSRPRSWRSAVTEIVRNAPDWGRVAMHDPDRVDQALARFLWLISIARRQVGPRIMPLFNVEVQLWVREVSRVVRSVEPDPRFRWLDSASRTVDNEPPPELELPAVSCRRCGMAGWMALRSELNNTTLITAPAMIYQQAVNRSPNVRTLIRTTRDEPNIWWFDPRNRELLVDEVPGAVPVLMTANDDDAKSDTCPACDERDAIRFLGLRVASLTSVSINTLFSSEHINPEERKLLAFTDSVQDASHRAAFFAGRTHRINLRAIMAGAIRERETITLDELGDELHARAESDHDRYGVTPPDLLKHPTVRTVWTEDVNPAGLEILRKRLGFEADLEFGLRTRVGRTLELSDAVAAHVAIDDETLALVLEDAEHLGGVDADPIAIGVWARGMLERLRIKGGLANELLVPYADSGGHQWHVWGGRPDGLPPFVPGIGRPTFATLATKGDFDSLTAMANTPTWVLDWTTTVLGVDAPTARELNRRLFPLLDAGTEVIRSWDAPNGRVFGLRRHTIEIHDLPDGDADHGLKCNVCGGRHVSPPHVFDDWVDTPCLRYRCTGRYQPDAGRHTSYYRKLYRSGITRRVVTGEHTGLLGRTEREELEQRFKTGTAADDENVLTATPTLEMGIDIGDLSAVLLTSVPRNPAAYLQRAGRAGRATGNSLVATFVPTDRHGLYYLAEPESMLAGDVRPPNCYLDAVDTLRRQYVAYLLDRTADLSIDTQPMPQQIGALVNKGFDSGGLFRIVCDASMHEPSHHAAFLGLFEGQLQDDTVEEIRHFAEIGIETRIKEAVELWQYELREMGNRIKRLNNAIEKAETLAEASGDDTEVNSLLGQRRAISNAMNERRGEYTLSALGRMGLLPNYTLVEDTVTLNASLWSRNDDNEFNVETWEYQRSGSMAVREFAPGNSFYAGGHRHIIDGLNIGAVDEPDHSPWRLCPECGYGEPEETERAVTECPRCGEVGIMGVGARHRMLRLREVHANGPEEGARVFDESDNRRQERFELVTTVDVDPAQVRGAWRLSADEAPAFGAELAPNTVLRTINLGRSQGGGLTGQTIPVAGQPRWITNFRTCKHCGTCQDVTEGKRRAGPEGHHQGWCKVRSGAISTSDAFTELVLYHELVTDAVRMLLPVSMFEVNERLASFKAALLLGLRKDFGGDPDHLRVALSDMPNRGGQGRRNFLVLYDRVPGGTGYLQRLAEPNRVKQILEQGREVIARCICQTEGRSACHRCMLGFIDRHEYDLVSRDTALWLLDQLLDEWQAESIDSVAGIDLSRTEESELERRFKVALQAWCDRPDHETLSLTPRAGKHGYDAFELRIDREDATSVRWHIDEQEGVSRVNTVPDFILRRADGDATPVAIYLDGFQFHASVENPNMADDAAKRMAMRSQGYHVWNMSWGDVEAFHNAAVKETRPAVPMRAMLEGAALNAAKATQTQRFSGGLDYLTAHQNPVELLLTYLAQPDDDRWEELAISSLVGVMAGAELRGQVDESGALAAAAAMLQNEVPAVEATGSFATAAVGETLNGLRVGAILRNEDAEKLRLTAVLSLADDADTIRDVATHRPRWQDWLQWANVLQFLRGAGCDALITTTGSDHSILDTTYLAAAADTDSGEEQRSQRVAVALSEQMVEELDFLVDADVKDLVSQALEHGAPDFVAGHEIDGVALEAAWPEHRIALVPEDWSDEPIDGWRYERPGLAPEELTDLLKGTT